MFRLRPSLARCYTVQILDPALLSIFATSLIVSSLLALVVTIVVRSLRLPTTGFWSLFLAVLAFSLLGFVTGQIMGQSRESAVGAVLPAVLTLLGGVAIYLIGSKGAQAQAIVSSMLFCFSITLLAGSLYGARLRVEFDSTNPAYMRSREIGLEQNRHAVEVQQLLDYVELLKLKRDFGEKEKLDLSRFNSVLERNPVSK